MGDEADWLRADGPVLVYARQPDSEGAFVAVTPPRELVPNLRGLMISGLALIQSDDDDDDELLVHAGWSRATSARMRLWLVDATDWSVRELVDLQFTGDSSPALRYMVRRIDETSALISIGLPDPGAGGFSYVVSRAWIEGRAEPCDDRSCLPILRAEGQP